MHPRWLISIPQPIMNLRSRKLRSKTQSGSESRSLARAFVLSIHFTKDVNRCSFISIMIGGRSEWLRQIKFSALLYHTRVGLSHVLHKRGAPLGPSLDSAPSVCIINNLWTFARMHVKVIAGRSLVHLLCIAHCLPRVTFFVDMMIIDVFHFRQNYLNFFHLTVCQLNLLFFLIEVVLKAIGWDGTNDWIEMREVLALVVLRQRYNHLSNLFGLSTISLWYPLLHVR